MRAVFVELPAFERHRSSYLDDGAFAALQSLLMTNPVAGRVIKGAGGLRKLRFADERRKKGRRGGLRIVYSWWAAGMQIWLFTLFDKDEAADLTSRQRAEVRAMIKAELDARRVR